MHDALEATNRYQPIHAPMNAVWSPQVSLVYRRWLHINLGRVKLQRAAPETGFEINLEFLDEPLALAEF